MLPMWILRPALPVLLLVALAATVPAMARAEASGGRTAEIGAGDPAPDAARFLAGDGSPSATSRGATGTSVETYAPPAATTLEHLNRTHRSGHWLIVSTPDSLIRLRADRFTPRGLEGIHTRDGLPPFPVLEWKNVAKIERRASGFRAGQVLIGVICSPIPPYGLTTAAGMWLGGGLGDKIVRTTTLYEGTPASVEPDRGFAIAAPDSGSTGIDRDHVEQRAATVGGVVPDLDRLRGDVQPGRLVHVWGGFGEFTGTVETIDPDGLHGLHPHRPPREARDRPPDPVAWSQISGMYRRGNSGGRGAAYGAVVLGGGAGAVAAAIASSGIGLSSGSSENALGAFFAGAAVGGIVGAGFGYAIGSFFKVWRPVRGLHASAMPEASLAAPVQAPGTGDPAQDP